MAADLAPGSDLVGVEWLKRVPGLPAGAIATKLPSLSPIPANSPLRGSGFITTRIVGGSPNRDVPMRAPVVAVSCWAASLPGSTKVRWGAANALAERVVAGTWLASLQQVALDFSSVGPSYLPARITTVIALTEPIRVEGDPAGLARFDVDLLINWKATL